tara:strand:- start:249 stop:644 length:396 start_codon:yes stop_codon:yes gene_type:complete
MMHYGKWDIETSQLIGGPQLSEKPDDTWLPVVLAENSPNGVTNYSEYSLSEDGNSIIETVKEFSNTIDYSLRNRSIRNELLTLTDWTQLADSPFSDSKKAEWVTYRQALRDITSHSNWPNLEEADWPTQPS